MTAYKTLSEGPVMPKCILDEYFETEKFKTVMVTGGTGFLGKPVTRILQEKGYQIFNVPHANFDLRNDQSVHNAFESADRYFGGPPDVVIHLAARGGGIGLNREKPGELFYDNIMMNTLVMEHARIHNVKKFVAIGTVCAYPKIVSVPFKEGDLWMGYPEETNAPYGLAKKMALVQAQAYRTQYGFKAIYLLPINMYGPHDHFDLQHAHVIPTLIRKFYEARQQNQQYVIVWGDGSATREFLYVDDCADAVVRAMERYSGPEPINIGTGIECSIKDIVLNTKRLTGFKGAVAWDLEKPNGQPRRSLSTERATYYLDGWYAKTKIIEGLTKTIEWYQKEGHRQYL